MAHPDGQEAVDTGAPEGDPVDDILKFVDGEPDDDEPEEGDDLDPEDSDPDEGDLDEDEDGEAEDEPETAITPPVSLNKEQKAAFAQLPADLQKVWADTEAQRNREVQLKTTEAAEAKRNAASEARGEVAAIQRQFAEELQIYANAFVPGEPDYSLLATNPQAFAAEMAAHKQLTAQYESLMQRVAAVRQSADQIDGQAHQQFLATEHARLETAWPEWGDASRRPALAQEIATVAKELGYPDDLLPQANATDILAVRKAAEWKAKADKFDAFQARKMANVRAAKALPRVAKPGTAPSRTQSKAARADAAWARAKTSKSGDDFADFLEAKGVSL